MLYLFQLCTVYKLLILETEGLTLPQDFLDTHSYESIDDHLSFFQKVTAPFSLGYHYLPH